MINIEVGIDRIALSSRGVNQLQREAKYALRQTVTQTAALARKELESEYKARLDRPIKYIYRAYFYEQARSLENPIALLKVATSGNIDKLEYVDAIQRTGIHVPTRLTKKYRQEGLLRPTESLQPTRAVRRNSRGNVGGRYVQTLLQKKNEKIVIKKGRYRGIYRNIRGRFTKVFTPAVVGRYRTNPAVNVKRVLIPLQKSFAKRFALNYQKNLARRK